MNSKQIAILLVTNSHTDAQSQILLKALSSYGRPEIVNHDQALTMLNSQSCALIVVDAGSVDDVPQFISWILALQPEAHVVVVTTSPSWRQARAALQAGAKDYLKVSLDLADLRKALAEVRESLFDAGNQKK